MYKIVPLLFLFILIFIGCKKELEFEQQKESAEANIALEQYAPHPIGGDSTEPDLVLGLFNGSNPEDFNYDGMQTFLPQVVRDVVVTNRMHQIYGWTVGDTIDVIRAACNVRNIAPRTYSIKRDRFDSTNFSFNEQTDAEIYIEAGHEHYILHDFLKSGTWVNGKKQFPSQYKWEFEPSAVEKKPLVDSIFFNGKNYVADIGYDYPVYGIQAQFGDEYFNLFRIPRGFNGMVTLNPTVNPEYAEDKHVSHESNYSNNTSVASFNIEGTSINYTTERPFPVLPPEWVKAMPSTLGKPKGRSFTISWEPVNDWFCVKRNIQYSNGSWTGDQEFLEVYNASSFVDSSPEIQGGNVKKIIYTIYTMTEGMTGGWESGGGRTIGISK